MSVYVHTYSGDRKKERGGGQGEWVRGNRNSDRPTDIHVPGRIGIAYYERACAEKEGWVYILDLRPDTSCRGSLNTSIHTLYTLRSLVSIHYSLLFLFYSNEKKGRIHRSKKKNKKDG